MVENLTDETINQFHYLFDFFDKDFSGTITTKELGTVMRNLGQNPSEEELKQLIREVDLNGDGTIDFKEFLCLMVKKMDDSDIDQELQDAFKFFDGDKDGYITSLELRNAMNNLGDEYTPEEAEEMIKEGDLDNDGKISFDEFMKIVLSK